MGKIHQLDHALSNKIAAGEVVERPASVVKELVENAIDANSTRVDIYVEEAGLSKIRIVDNGDGIDPEDCLLAFSRHATSKIADENDLFRIRTLGFRGEALPSIASVSELELKTSNGTDPGTLIFLRGGEVVKHESTASRKGTEISVSNLFFNTPARLKYMKTIHTELGNISDMMNRIALAHPNISFRLFHNDKKLLQTSGNGDLLQVIASIYGISIAKKMVPIKLQSIDFDISGYIALPEVNRASRNYITTIINDRFIKNFTLSKAIQEGYHTLLPIGRFPIVFISIQMDPLLVDVNVHPTKLEVRLSKEKELYDIVQEGIKRVFRKEQLIPDFEVPKRKTKNQDEQQSFMLEHATPNVQQMSTNEQPSSNHQNPVSTDEQSALNQNPLPTNEPPASHQQKRILTNEKSVSYYQHPVQTNAHQHQQKQVKKEEQPAIIDQQSTAMTTEMNLADSEGSYQHSSSQSANKTTQEYTNGQHERALYNHALTEHDKPSNTETVDYKEHKQERVPALYPIGQLHGTYILAQNENGLYIIDQHAAQERIKYEFFKEKVAEVQPEVQELLLPLTLEYTSNESMMIEKYMEELGAVGVFLEPFGSNTFIVKSHPQWFPLGMEQEIIEEMIEQVIRKNSVNLKELREDAAILMSCKASIKANEHLRNDEIFSLLESLRQSTDPFTCPHGRPIILQFSTREIEKMFKRIM